MKKLLALTLALTLTLVGCASTNTGSSTPAPSPAPPALVITGASIVALGNSFASVSVVVTAKCKAKEYTVATCTNYRLFGEKFKIAYPAAKSLWNAAATYEDAGISANAVAALQKLAADLAPFLALTGVK